LVGSGVVELDNADEVPVWGWPIILLMALPCIAVGGGLLFGRRWTTLDRAQNSVEKRWGLLVPMGCEQLRRSDYNAVRIAFDPGDSDTADRFPVFLTTAGEKNLTLCTSAEYNQSRQQAAFVATFLGFPLEDATTDHKVFGTASA
jgi:hypothetical protein